MAELNLSQASKQQEDRLSPALGGAAIMRWLKSIERGSGSEAWRELCCHLKQHRGHSASLPEELLTTQLSLRKHQCFTETWLLSDSQTPTKPKLTTVKPEEVQLTVASPRGFLSILTAC